MSASSVEYNEKNNNHKEQLRVDTDDSASTAIAESSLLPYRLPADKVAEQFGTNVCDGLTSSQHAELIKKYGPNTLGEGDKVSYTKCLAHHDQNHDHGIGHPRLDFWWCDWRCRIH